MSTSKRALPTVRNGTNPIDVVSILFRLIVAGNLVLIAFTWWPWFAGSTERAGAADALFGTIRFGGFRADFIWLVVSSIAIFFALWVFLLSVKSSRPARINAFLCLVEILAFCLYVYRILASGLLDFG